MGCQPSHTETSERYLSEQVSDEFARQMSSFSVPVVITTRAHDPDQVVDQWMHASVSEASKCGRIASKHSCSTRMSRMKPDARQAMIDNIKHEADQRGEQRTGLESRLNSFGMRTKEMEADGNCQFRSFAFNLFGEQNHHAVTRKAAVAHMEKHHQYYSIFFETQGDFKNYLRDMARNHTWGDELTLRAVVEAYSCEAHVVTSEAQNWYLVYHPESKEQLDTKVAFCPKGYDLPRPGKQVFLSYISPIHYNSIITFRATE